MNEELIEKQKIDELPVVDKLEDGDYIISVVGGKVVKSKCLDLLNLIYKTISLDINSGESADVDMPLGVLFRCRLSSGATAIYFKRSWGETELTSIGKADDDFNNISITSKHGKGIVIKNNSTKNWGITVRYIKL